MLLALFAFLFAAIAALALALPLVGGGADRRRRARCSSRSMLALLGMRSVKKAGMPTPDEAIVEAKATVDELKEDAHA